MPVERRSMSVSQFSELVGIEPTRFRDVECNRLTSTVVLVLEPEEDDMQTTGTFPQLADNTRRKPTKKGGR